MGQSDVFEVSAEKADPALVSADAAHFAAVAECLRLRLAATAARRAELLATPERRGRGAMERDEEIHRLGGLLRTLRRARLDVCLGRMVPAEGDPSPLRQAQGEPSSGIVYIGRVGLIDDDDRQLLVDWRTPAAEPFFEIGRASCRERGLVGV